MTASVSSCLFVFLTRIMMLDTRLNCQPDSVPIFNPPLPPLEAISVQTSHITASQCNKLRFLKKDLRREIREMHDRILSHILSELPGLTVFSLILWSVILFSKDGEGMSQHLSKNQPFAILEKHIFSVIELHNVQQQSMTIVIVLPKELIG